MDLCCVRHYETPTSSATPYQTGNFALRYQTSPPTYTTTQVGKPKAGSVTLRWGEAESNGQPIQSYRLMMILVQSVRVRPGAHM